MKKIFTLIALFFTISFSSSAQSPILCEDFNNYDSLVSSVDWHGWYISYNTQFSYYTSTQSSGSSGPNSYKFGVDSATMITPNIAGALSISFWMKGNFGTPPGPDPASMFYVYESSDSSIWNLVDSIQPSANISSGGHPKSYNVSPGTQYVKFYYHKSSGNVAFDDFCAYDGPVGIFGVAKNTLAISLYPNPSNGIINIKTSTFQAKGLKVTVSNVLGKQVKEVLLNNPAALYTVNLNDLDAGIYMVRVRSEFGESTQRVILRK
ncbi:MAG TPA: T9SS type A sorting domain-containing protein [Bacteroidia bacterium]|nr:T9SS type A sorting domain-containing protein [Bacteroidia bacterium]HNS11503.1 T9SS type A sorting domain-containing protein [Bacteroidia bacterium]